MASVPIPDVTRRYLTNALIYFGVVGYLLLDDLGLQARDTNILTRSISIGALRALALLDMPGAREAFAATLAESGQKVAIAASVDQLRAMLHDPNPLNRRAGIALLGRLGTAAAPAVDEIVPYINDPDPTYRAIAILSLGRIGPAAARAVPAMLASVNWSNPTGTLGVVLQALDNIGPAAVDASDTLVNAILQPAQTDRAGYAMLVGNTLAHTGLTPAARQALRAALAPTAGSGDAALAQRALGMLPPLVGMLGIGRQALLDLALGDSDRDSTGVRTYYVGRALARQTPEDVAWTVAELRRLLRQAIAADDARRMNTVLKLLTEMGPAAAPALNDLRAVLSDERVSGWFRPIGAFGPMGAAAAPAIPDMLRVIEPLAAKVAALDPNATDPKEHFDRSSLLSELQDGLRAFGYIGVGTPDLLAFLHRLIHGPDADIRDAALNTLEALGPAAAPMVNDLRQALDDPRPDTVRQVIDALGKMGPAAFPALGELCRRLDAQPDKNIVVSLDVTLATLLPHVSEAPYDPAFRDDDRDIPAVPAVLRPWLLAREATPASQPAVMPAATSPAGSANGPPHGPALKAVAPVLPAAATTAIAHAAQHDASKAAPENAARRPWWRRVWSRAR